MSLSLRSSAPAALLVAGLVVVSSTSGAVAGAMITGKNIKDGTVTSADIKNLTLRSVDTSTELDTYMRRVGGYSAQHRSAVVAAGDQGSVDGSCPAGTQILGSATWWASAVAGPQVQISSEEDYTRRATAYALNERADADTLHLTLFCGRTVE